MPRAASINRSRGGTLRSGRKLLDAIHAVRVEREVSLDRGDGRIRVLVGPDRVLRRTLARPDGVVGGVILVRAMGLVRGPLQQRHVGVFARDVLDRWQGRLLERERAGGVGDHASFEKDAHSLPLGLYRDRMI